MMFFEAAQASTIALPQASSIASRIDTLYDFLFWLSLVLLVGTMAVAALFVVRYHRSRKGRTTAYILGSHKLEIVWTVIPLILMLAIFAWGYRDYVGLRSDLRDPFEISVVGRQWLWNFEYANGRKTMNELYLPKGRAIKLIMTSEDVIHSFFVPNFRLKQDVVPGMYTYLSFVPTEVGRHPVYCAEFCGTQHSEMLAKAIVLESADFDAWLETGKVPNRTQAVQPVGAPAETKVAVISDAMAGGQDAGQNAGKKAEAAPVKAVVDKGRQLYSNKTCSTCHSVDGTRRIGPSFKGVWGSQVELQNGAPVKFDENYFRESVMEPNLKLVKGYPPSMPTFKGQLSDEEINALIALLKSLK